MIQKQQMGERMKRQQFSALYKKREIRPAPPDDDANENNLNQYKTQTIKTEQQIFRIFTRR